MMPPRQVWSALIRIADEAAIGPGAQDRVVTASRVIAFADLRHPEAATPNSMQISAGDAGAPQVGWLNIRGDKFCRWTERSTGIAGVLFCRQVR
jgi:hypothetical protein